jgi:hypothetical protein
MTTFTKVFQHSAGRVTALSSNRTVRGKNHLKEKAGRATRDATALERSAGDVMTRKAADLKDGGPRNLLKRRARATSYLIPSTPFT